jgi:hypothetical protein
MPRLVCALALALVAAAPANAVVIHNGLAPPNPANVIDAGNSFPAENVNVQNVGCDVTVQFPCVAPGAPTAVSLVNGGVVGGALIAFESSTVTMSGGSVTGTLIANGSSAVGMSNGAVSGDLIANNSSTIAVSGGSVAGSVIAFDSSAVTLAGGFVTGDLVGFDSASVTMNGGWVGGKLLAVESSAITLFGTGFAVDGTPVGYGPIAALSGTLTGTLLSGDALGNPFCHAGCTQIGSPLTGLITLVPEPSTPLLITSSGALGLGLTRRRQR